MLIIIDHNILFMTFILSASLQFPEIHVIFVLLKLDIRPFVLFINDFLLILLLIIYFNTRSTTLQTFPSQNLQKRLIQYH